MKLSNKYVSGKYTYVLGVICFTMLELIRCPINMYVVGMVCVLLSPTYGQVTTSEAIIDP